MGLTSEKAAMEAPVGQKSQKQHEFALASVSDLASSSSSSDVASSSPPAIARFGADCGIPELRFNMECASGAVVNVDLRTAQVCFHLFFCGFVFRCLFDCRESEGKWKNDKEAESELRSLRILWLRGTCLVAFCEF